MRSPSWLIELDRVHSSYLLLGSLVAVGLAAAVLYQVGLLGWVLQVLGGAIRGSIHKGFQLWKGLLSWASWPLFLAIVVGLLVGGEAAAPSWPGARICCGLATLSMGVLACLAYMFIDLERYEVERGYKAVHNPLKGQFLAEHLARYGQQVGIPLLIAATVGIIGGFALLNQGLYETVGRDWYRAGEGQGDPLYIDFLAYALINLLGIVDVLNVAQSYQFLRTAYVHQARWPASTLMAGFRAFFTMVLLQQIFASLRQGKLLAETITDFWSPHEPIRERARNALPQYGTLAIEPLLLSLRSVPFLTKEQREQLPLIMATVGPSAIPVFVRYLRDPHEHVRAVAVAALGHLHAVAKLPRLVELSRDPSDMVRQSLVETLGIIGSVATQPVRKKHSLRQGFRSWRRRIARLLQKWRKRDSRAEPADAVELAVTTLQLALADHVVAVRTQAALALGRIGPAAAAVVPLLIALLKDSEETVRCRAAEALGQVKGDEGPTVAALAELLGDASSTVKAAAAAALGQLKTAAVHAVPALVPLLQDREESVRTAAAEAIAQAGPLNGATTETLVEGLVSSDNVVRAQTAEALGTIGAVAEDAAPALVEAITDSNDLVRARAVEALGKIGEAAAPAAVPGLVRALRDQDNWVSALAAEALGQMGESADGAVPALIGSLRHANPQVRSNAAEALGKMGPAAAGARRALETAAGDADGAVRSQAIRALGTIGPLTATSTPVVLTGLQDADPLVRAAAVESVGRAEEPGEAVLDRLLPLLEDANDQVRVEVTKVLPKLTGATPAVLDGLCRRLLEDVSSWVQVHAALALGRLGPAAAAAGGPLLRAAQTADASVREQAMRAIAMIQPPETLAAFTLGLRDANIEIRKVASGGWMKAATIPEEVIPELVAALRDPDVQVRANVAHALSRLESLPGEAIPLLLACTVDGNDGLRMNAAAALALAPASVIAEAMQLLIDDPNSRVRLIAAGALLAADPGNTRARDVLMQALADPALRLRRAAVGLLEALGARAAMFVDVLQGRSEAEPDPELRKSLGQLVERLADAAKPERGATPDLAGASGP